MNYLKFDIVIIGGGLTGSLFALEMKKRTDVKILIVEHDETFQLKPGEAISDLTALYLTRLNLDGILSRQSRKSGLRFLFEHEQQTCEFTSPTLPGVIRGYHLNRSTLDEELLDECVKEGIEVWRPASITKLTYQAFNTSIEVAYQTGRFHVNATWIIDASGRSRYLPHVLGWDDLPVKLNTSSMMCYYTGLDFNKNWDHLDHNYWTRNAIGDLSYATTHIMRKNHWWWIIRLNEELTSVGVVFDHQHSQPDDFDQAVMEDRLLSQLMNGTTHGPIRKLDGLSHLTQQMYQPGIVVLGDSWSFIDPLFSPGLELLGQQTVATSDLLADYFTRHTFHQNQWKRLERSFQCAFRDREEYYQVAYQIMHNYPVMSSWIQLANYVYNTFTIIPSIWFPKRMKYPKTLNRIEKMLFRVIKKRYLKLGEYHFGNKKSVQPSNIELTGDWKMIIKPFHLLWLWFKGYVRLEIHAIIKH
ncbi:MAG: tryptophan 7-halogenase [Cyclobacteriaceae bacterium]